MIAPIKILWGDKAPQNSICSFCSSDVLGEASEAVSLRPYVVVKVTILGMTSVGWRVTLDPGKSVS